MKAREEAVFHRTFNGHSRRVFRRCQATAAAAAALASYPADPSDERKARSFRHAASDARRTKSAKIAVTTNSLARKSTTSRYDDRSNAYRKDLESASEVCTSSRLASSSWVS